MFGKPNAYQHYVFNASVDPDFKKLAESYHIPETWDEYFNEMEYGGWLTRRNWYSNEVLFTTREGFKTSTNVPGRP